MRREIIQHALGSTETVFGPKQLEGKPIPRTVDTESGEVLQPAANEEGQLGMFPEGEPKQEPELSPVDKLKELLKDYKEKIPADRVGSKDGRTVHQLIDVMVANPKSTEKDLNSAIDWCEDQVQKAKAGGAA